MLNLKLRSSGLVLGVHERRWDMPKVFISYSSSDSDFAELAKLKLQERDIEIWLDQGELHPGDDWRDGIDEGLLSSDALIVLLSEKSSASAYVTFEWAYALGKGAKVIPVQLQKAETHPRLEALQYLDFTNPRVRPWDKLYEEIERRSNRDTSQNKHHEAEVVYNFAINSFMDKLTLQFRTVHLTGFGATLPGFKEDSPSIRSTNAFGEMVGYDLNKREDEAKSELRSLVKRIASLRKNRERNVTGALLSLFNKVQGSTQSIAHQLGKIRFGSTTLEDPWRIAQEHLYKLWQDKSKEVSYFERRDLDRVRLFLEEHASYQQLTEEDRQQIESFLHPGNLMVEDLIDLTRGELEQSLKKPGNELL
jgi:hypothetical protein